MKMHKMFTVGVNLLGASVWFFNYFMLNSLLCLGIGATMILIAAFILTADKKLGRIN